MDPATIAGVGVISKLIGLGISSWSALDDRDFDKDDLQALRTLLDTGASISGMRKPAAMSAGARHLALIARSFGRAVGRHQEFHGKLLLTGGLRRWLSRKDKERAAEIEQRVRLATLRVRELGNDPRGEIDRIDSLAGTPLATPYYRALWHAFSDPGLTIAEAGEEPPLVMSNTARREFERYFLLAYLEGIAAPAGGSVDEYLEGLQRYRGVLVRDLLVQNLATWGGRHVFGNVPRERWDEDEAVPFMPLEDMYVEPSGALLHEGQEQEDRREPLLALIERLVAREAAPKVIVVAADFGSGKSLSARALARRWAEQFLSSPAASLGLPLPIHVRCAADFPSEKVDLELTVRRAWKRQANDFDYSVSDEDGAFAWPGPEQHVVCMLDGLDEVSLGEQHLKTLFQKLAAKTSRNHRFVLFSRPGALPAKRELGDDVVLLQVRPFDTAQVEQWLACWNQLRPEHPAITLQGLQERRLDTITQTPILLLMVAFTWIRHATSAEPPSLAEIYEHFFHQIASGKAEADREQHGPIAAASEQLLAALQNAKLLEESAGRPDAMLWLMGRVAWEAHMLEQRHPPEPLTRRHLENLLHEGSVTLPPGAADTIKIGLILALQADLYSANHTILFGHQSFREFLVGRHWALAFQRIVRGGGRRDRSSAPLMGGRLLASNDKSFDFLMDLINTPSSQQRSSSPLSWNDHERNLLVRWAQETFEDEQQEFGERARANSRADARLRNDQRAELREAALAIGSMTKGSPGIHAKDPLTLRSMLAWFWLQSLNARVIARKADFQGADLQGASLEGANFSEANLRKANLIEVYLGSADFNRANLSEADLVRARGSNANFNEADLNGADLRNSDLSGSSFTGAQFERSSLIEANLPLTNLSNANLAKAALLGATLLRADLRGANLQGAGLSSANLQSANLAAAILQGANLFEADLRGADLRGADLRGANLRGANLSDVKLKGNKPGEGELPDVRFDQFTVWPDDFDRTTLPSMTVDTEPKSRPSDMTSAVLDGDLPS